MNKNFKIKKKYLLLTIILLFFILFLLLPRQSFACVYPSSSGCTKDSDLTYLKGQLAKLGALNTSGVAAKALQKCEQEIANYKQQLIEYNLCVQARSQQITEALQRMAEEEEKYRTIQGYYNTIEYCIKTHGQEAFYNTETNRCECKTGFAPDSNKPFQCIPIELYCKDLFGPNATNKTFKYIDASDENCTCLDGYIVNNNKCITYTQACQNQYGPNSYGDKNYCHCIDGYKFNENKTACIKIEITSPVKTINDNEEQALTNQNSPKIDINFAKKHSGKLFLQTEQRGKIWYVDPASNKRYEVTFANALNLFQRLAVGITDENLSKIPLHTENKTSTLGNTSKGKLFLQVEQKGKIWYVDFNGKRWEVTWANLMDLFRSLALGITDNDLDKIPVGVLD